MVGAIALSLLVACGSKSKGNIECETNAQCPTELTCDTDQGKCVDPGSGNTFECQPALPGCACKSGDPEVVCLIPGQDPGLVGSCRQGRSLCVDNVYAACELVPNVYCSNVGVSSGDFDITDDNSDNVSLGPEGEIVLVPDVKEVDFGFLWIANTGENTVSKVDIETGREVARYASVRGSGSLGIPGVPSPGAFDGDQQNCGNCPSRTAIDFEGDAFVANRAFDQQGTVTKFANDPVRCVDRNGNGVIDTSTDLDGDGIINVSDAGEFLGESDECIIWTVPVGNNNGVPRGLAIDAGGPDGEAGNVWVGLFSESRVVQISGDTGAPITRGGSNVSVDLTAGSNSMSPYGAAVDGGGYLWVTGIQDGDTTYLAKVNTFSGELVQLYGIPDDDDQCSKSYGISIDTSQRIWLGGWNCQDVKAFDQFTETWIRRDLDSLGNTRGVAVDTAGYVWVALTDGGVARIKIDDIVNMGNAAPAEQIALPELAMANGPVDNTIGVGIDRNGNCWAVSRNDDAELGTAHRIDPAGNVEPFPVGHRPYTYSDFTGFGLSTVVRPNGYWRGVLEGCATTDAITEWETLEWFEREPPGTRVRMRVRVANTVAELATAGWFGPWDDSPVDLAAAGVPDAKVMQVEVQLSTDDPAVSPAFLGFNVGFSCPGVPPVE
jgi:hypothetical protein